MSPHTPPLDAETTQQKLVADQLLAGAAEELAAVALRWVERFRRAGSTRKDLDLLLPMLAANYIAEQQRRGRDYERLLAFLLNTARAQRSGGGRLS